MRRAGVVITFSSHLHDRSSCLIKALKHNTPEGEDNEIGEKEETRIGIKDTASQQATELVRC